MALSKIQAESMNLADTYAFTGTVSGAGKDWTESAAIGTLDSATHTVTGIPNDAREIIMTWNDVGNTGSSNVSPKIQLGTSSGLVTSGYRGVGIAHYTGGTVYLPTSSIGIINIGDWGASSKYDAICHVFSPDLSGNVWLGNTVLNVAISYNAHFTFSSRIELGGTLDRIAMNVNSGTFSGGTARVFYR